MNKEEILELNDKKYNVNLPKEVKEAFICIDYELSVCSCELPKILDYITNLQKDLEYSDYCNEQLRKRITNLEYKINLLQGEDNE